MRGSFHRLRHDERGVSLVFVSVAFMALLSATTLAIDVGMFMTARSQAQNAADAGALAGATALTFNSFTNRSATGPAVQSAVNTALRNTVQGAAVSVTPDDVTFPLDPSGQADRVAVQVHRTTERGNAVQARRKLDIDRFRARSTSLPLMGTCSLILGFRRPKRRISVSGRR